ncbi:CARDB domain-containing protein [Pimelobacter simplex]|uniref:CARDB domain-containing protein n=1 Tax=Nocardioides simplex TaxID=2045 RepID=UPI003AAC1C05
MQARRTAAAAALTVLGASLATVGTHPDAIAAAAAAAPRADLVVPAVGTPPAKVRHGSRFNLGATVANKGRAVAKPSSLRFYLSKDRARSGDDIVAGTLAVKKIKPRKKTTISGRVDVPWGTADGKYWVLACADATNRVKETKEANNCQSSKTQVTVDAALHAALAGHLTFIDQGQRTDPSTGRTETWKNTATANISMKIDGPRLNPRFASTGSTYGRVGSLVGREVTPSCVYDRERDEVGSGTLRYTGDRFTDDIFGHFTRTDLSGVRIGLFMRAAWTDTSKQTGQGQFPCENTSRTTTGTGLDVSDIELKQVAITTSAITYRVVGWVAEQGTPSDWDKVEGTLTLTLR